MTISAEKMDRLAEKFPFMTDKDYNESLYCDITDGWYPLLEKLCREIADAYDTAGLPMDLCVVDVKQELGSLSFDFHFNDENATADTAERVSELHRKIVEIVRFYEDKSTSVCEDCGQPGELRDDSGFMIVLCDDCYAKNQMRRKMHSRSEEVFAEIFCDPKNEQFALLYLSSLMSECESEEDYKIKKQQVELLKKFLEENESYKKQYYLQKLSEIEKILDHERGEID